MKIVMLEQIKLKVNNHQTLSFKKIFLLPILFLSICACTPAESEKPLPEDVGLASRTIQNCQTDWLQGTKVRWCRERLSNSSNQEVIYYFHGILGNEYSWKQSSLRLSLYQGAESKGTIPPQVITISLGDTWFINDVDRYMGTYTNRLVLFKEKIIPDIEQKLKLNVSKRYLIGESMGGYNAFQLAAKYPSNFQKAVILCAAFLPVGPYSSNAEKQAFIARNKPWIQEEKLLQFMPAVLKDFPNAESWTKNNPINISANLQTTFPKSIISGNEYDEFGFREGDQIVAENLWKDGNEIEYFQVAKSSHCQHDKELLTRVNRFLLF